jgi:hypothetical protein
MEFSTKKIISVCYEPRGGCTLITLGVRYMGKLCALTQEIPLKRECITSDHHAAILALASIEASEGAYTICL